MITRVSKVIVPVLDQQAAPDFWTTCMKFSIIRDDSYGGDAAGNTITPAVAGLPSGVPDEVPHIIELAPSRDGKTQITVTEDGYTSENVRAQSEIGQAQCLDKMQALFKRTSDTSGPR
jgi:hypothetical protein